MALIKNNKTVIKNTSKLSWINILEPLCHAQPMVSAVSY